MVVFCYFKSFHPGPLHLRASPPFLFKDDPLSAPKRPVPVPWLQLKGLWLAAAGFDVRTPVRVRVMQGCLVVTSVDQ
ncbi:MAG: SymE family type I addiction module toxin [Sedimenticola sp.]